MFDDGGLVDWLGEKAHERLSNWSRQNGVDHKLISEFDNGGTQAKVGIVNRHRRQEGRTEKLVIKIDKYDSSDLTKTEYARHRESSRKNSDWADKHLARLVEPLLEVGDGRWIVFQTVAGASDQFDVLSSLHWGLLDRADSRWDSEDFAAAIGAVVSGVLGDWNGPPNISYPSVPDYLRSHFAYRLNPGKPLTGLFASSGDPVFALFTDPALSEGIVIEVPFGETHGDMHLENILVSTRPSLKPADFKLIDLANREEHGPLARDPAHLLIHMINRSLEGLGSSAREALPAVLLDPENSKVDRLPLWLYRAIEAVHQAGDAWAAGFGPEWRRARPLSLYAATLMVYVRRTTREQDKPWLLNFAQMASDRFLAAHSRRKPPGAEPKAQASSPPRQEREPAKYIVGREAEPHTFDHFIGVESNRRVLNIFGPGGIGKTEVSKKLIKHAKSNGVLVGSVDVSAYADDPSRILQELVATLMSSERGEPFGPFLEQLRAYDEVRMVVEVSGGVAAMFELTGTPRDPSAIRAVLDRMAAPSDVQSHLENRFKLERYLRTSIKRLTGQFGDLLGEALDAGPGALFLDTYEEIRSLDRWVRLDLLPMLPDRAKVVVLGRNDLTRQNFDWLDHTDEIVPRALPELSQDEAEAYLRHHGLTDPAALKQIYAVTGGYPLLLVLVRQLSGQAGGWKAVGELEYATDRDQIASGLLDRILREERVHAVREVLEKCCVASWINPEIISELLDVGLDESKDLFERIRVHSFTERHPPDGVRIHDKIRQLLCDRLRFTSEKEFNRLETKLLDYHAAKSKILKSAP